MNLGLEAAAKGIIDVANVNIDRALRRVSVARGYDPRDFTLVAFGGAGPLHACEVAERVGIRRILVPRYPGVMCALGLLAADVALDYSRSVLGTVTDETPAMLDAIITDLSSQARNDLAREGIDEAHMLLRPLADMRYQGQAYELTVHYPHPLAPSPLHGEGEQDTSFESQTLSLIEAFHAAHRRTYGHAMPERPVEVVNVRLQAVGIIDKPAFERWDVVGTNRALSVKLRDDGVTLYERDSLQPGDNLDSPALVFQLDSTTLVAAGWSARVDGYRNLILERI
jgi:N-methylhydantoinase A